MLFHVVAHITIVLIVAFFVLFTASRADGFVKLLGTILGAWLVLIAVVIVVGHVTAPMFGGKPFGMDMDAMHGGWMHRDGMHPDAPAAPAPATPAKPTGH